MILSAAGLARIKRYEACSLVVYDDIAGLPTIGWGHLLNVGEDFAAGISEEEAEALLLADLHPRVEAVVACLEIEVTQDQFDSCVSLLYNIGEKAFRESSFLRAVNAGVDNADIVFALMKWNKARNPKTGKLEVSSGLTRRRASEAKAWPFHG